MMKRPVVGLKWSRNKNKNRNRNRNKNPRIEGTSGRKGPDVGLSTWQLNYPGW